ncbi:MAG: hypothetical protein P4M14_05345, partial [Gammaproteobacteria bacterium]|nr:hypothetical protein [Gammaproteobacteria bacterium]
MAKRRRKKLKSISSDPARVALRYQSKDTSKPALVFPMVLPSVPLVSIDPRSNPTIHEQILEQQLLRNANENSLVPYKSNKVSLHDSVKLDPELLKSIKNIVELEPEVTPEELEKLKKDANRYLMLTHDMTLDQAQSYVNMAQKQIKELESQSENNAIEKKQREIENIKNLFANKTNQTLIKILKDNNIAEPKGKYFSKMNKPEIIKLLETNKLADYNQMWIDKNKSPTGSEARVEPLKPKPVVKLRDTSSSSSSSSSSQIGTGSDLHNVFSSDLGLST